MPDGAELDSIATNYRRFARDEAHGRSQIYEQLSTGVAEDRQLQELLATLPPPKRQPNLLLGSVRFRVGEVQDYASFRELVTSRWPEIAEAMLTLRTQTNEVARCGTLLPLLLELPQPLALFEVGASAGLCVLLDRYSYDFGAGRIGVTDSDVQLRCEVRGSEAPQTVPEVIWRAGMDIEPVDVNDPVRTRWLESLVWPGEDDRLARLRAAIEVARRDPPPVFAGDMLDGIGRFLAEAPLTATVVVFHSAVLNYVARDDRKTFVDEMSALDVVWLANEGIGVVPGSRELLDQDEQKVHSADFLLTKNGTPVAWTDPHGRWVELRSS